MKRIAFVAALLAILLSACGPQATPTIDPAQVQASAVAAANTMVAQTQAAIPTATEVPPTLVPSPTALPSPTPQPLPTISIQASPTPVASTGNCNGPLDLGSDNPARAHLKINNNTKGQVTISLWKDKDAFGQCGYLSWQIGKSQSITVYVPQTGQGPCYYAYAIINDPKKPSKAVGSGYCMNNPDKWTIDIGYDFMKLSPP